MLPLVLQSMQDNFLQLLAIYSTMERKLLQYTYYRSILFGTLEFCQGYVEKVEILLNS